MATIETRLDGRILRVAQTAEHLRREVADALALKVAEALRTKPVFTLALAGGNTPRALYQLLASEYRHGIPWQDVHLFWGDERYVPHDHPASNFRMVYESLIAPLNLPDAQIHPMPTHLAAPEEAAQQYEQYLRQFPTLEGGFDLVLLGMGTDGHVASLFPQTAALLETTRWVTVGEAPTEPRLRLTLTLPVLNRAHSIFLLVTGADKSPTVRRVLVEGASLPANRLSPRGELIWWLDSEAASDTLEAIAEESERGIAERSPR